MIIMAMIWIVRVRASLFAANRLGITREVKRNVQAIFRVFLFFSRSIWTHTVRQFKKICASAYNDKLQNATHSGVSEVLFLTKSTKWKKRQSKKWTVQMNTFPLPPLVSPLKSFFAELPCIEPPFFLKPTVDHRRSTICFIKLQIFSTFSSKFQFP